MTEKPMCPMHPWQELRHTPDDDIRQYECPKCGWMATERFIQEMTPKRIAQIREDHERMQRFHAEEPARRQAERLDAQFERMRDAELKESEKQKTTRTLTDYI